MKKAYREYLYKGWQIRASEYYNDWECQPYYKDDTEGKKWENFCNHEEVRFNTLKECKEWVKTEEAQKLKAKYNI